MPLLHPTHLTHRIATAAPAANKPQPRKDSLGFTPLRKPTSRKDVLAGMAPALDVLQYPGTDVALRAPYIKSAVRCQTADRVCRKHSAIVGASFGGVLGLVAGCASGPFFPVVGAGVALVGAALGAAAPWKEAASFGHIRKHLFFKIGIVASRAESATLVAVLKKNKILRKGRERDILALQNLDTVLKSQPYLNSKQRKQVRECLEFIAHEGASFDALTQERIRLQGAIAQAQKWQRRHGEAAVDMQALMQRQRTIDSRLMAGTPVAPVASANPSGSWVLRQSPKTRAPAKARPQLPSGPQHLTVGQNA